LSNHTINNQNLNDLADKLSSVLPDSVKTLKSDISSNVKAVLESGLREMNLVSREEFDVQSALLARTLKKLDKLEKQIEDLL
jgi:BMFP domain-containing protein YqiC